ncbi:hypothetical protein BDAP_002209 [Binucleata daphniae]
MILEKTAKNTKFTSEMLPLISNRYGVTVDVLYKHYLQITSLSHRTTACSFKWSDCLTKEVYTALSFDFERVNTLLSSALISFYDQKYNECIAVVLQIRKIKCVCKQIDLSIEFTDFLLYYCYYKHSSISLLLYNQHFHLNKAYECLNNLYNQKGYQFTYDINSYVKAFLSKMKADLANLFAKYCIEKTEQLKKQNKTACAYKLIESCTNVGDTRLQSIVESLKTDLKIQSQFDTKREMQVEDEKIITIEVRPFADIIKDIKFVDLASDMLHPVVKQKLNKYNLKIDKSIKALNYQILQKQHKTIEKALAYFQKLSFTDFDNINDIKSSLEEIQNDNMQNIEEVQERIKLIMDLLKSTFLSIKNSIINNEIDQRLVSNEPDCFLDDLDNVYNETKNMIYKLKNLKHTIIQKIPSFTNKLLPLTHVIEFRTNSEKLKTELLNLYELIG